MMPPAPRPAGGAADRCRVGGRLQGCQGWLSPDGCRVGMEGVGMWGWDGVGSADDRPAGGSQPSAFAFGRLQAAGWLQVGECGKR
jgi:hypothetical protein